MLEKEKLNKYAENLEFKINEKEYETLQNEFDILLKQVEIISKIEGIKDYEPLDFPFPLENSYLREDKTNMKISREDALKNASETKNNCISVPKVVE
ncbi:MAG: Asp-tRNA(Asn)/Glu-tRNA(Gln) amidotransferase subunit GatC [Bacilli bacterium]|nr:Asp-tRNA(Asn)/Glu-tRNA(Gln) amidotransferase subunit GatC [Bacilli bacterium]